MDVELPLALNYSLLISLSPERKKLSMADNGQPHRSNNQQDSLQLALPSFSLPNDMEDQYEMWSVRLPVSVDVEAMDEIQVRIAEEDSSGVLGTFDLERNQYGLVSGHAVEHESFRLLLPEVRSNNDDSESDSDDNVKSGIFMRPSEVRFHRHINVVDVACLRDAPEAELAPRLEIAPEPADPARRSYSSIPQVSGLKRRWMPPGVTAALTGFSNPSSRSYTESSKRDDASVDGKRNGMKLETDIVNNRLSKTHSKEKKLLDPKRQKGQSWAATPDTSLQSSDTTRSEDKAARKKAKEARKAAKKAKKERKREKTHRKEKSQGPDS